MAYSFQEWINPGTVSTVSLGIEYISSAHLTWKADGVQVAPASVVDGVAVFSPALTGVGLLLVTRTTPAGALPNEFSDGAMFSEASIDQNFRWLMFMAQEAIEQDGLGNPSEGGAVLGVFYENNNTLYSSHTISEDKNAMTAGPITVDDGVVVTVPTGSTWTVV